jgi:predicted HD phosphohydrolase
MMADDNRIQETQHFAKFPTMTDGTAQDWQLIMGAYNAYNRALPERLIEHLNLLRGDRGGFAVDRLEHTLQTATRALRDGRDEEYVVCALIHDIGDTLGPCNHAEVAAVILKPFVSEQNHWMVEKHAIFQGYYFFHHIGLDRNMREPFRGHPHYEYTLEFCDRYDQNSFDPNYDTLPLDAFEPMLRRVLAQPKQSIYIPPDDRSRLGNVA